MPFPRLCRWLACLGSLLTAFFILLSQPVFAGTQTPPVDTKLLAPDIRRIIERGELIVAMPKADSAPFFYVKDGQIQGIDVELAQGLANELQVRLRINRDAASFNDVVAVIARGEADVAICKLSRTIGRAKSIRFSDPYLKLRHMLAVNRIRFAALSKERDLPSVVRHFEGTIGVIASSSYVDFARRNFPKAKIVELPSWNDLVSALKKGEVDAAYRDEFEVKRLFKSNPSSSLVLRAVTLTDTQDSLAAAVHQDAHQLLALINLYLAQRPEALTIDSVLKQVEAP